MKDDTGPVHGRIWTASNGLSLLRLLMAIPVVFLTVDPVAYRWWIIALCLLAYISDLLDGYLARHLNQESDLGRILDPVADKVFVAVFAVMLSIGGVIPVWFLSVVIGRDLLILAAGTYLRARKRILAQSNSTGKMAVVAIGLSLMLSLFRDVTGEPLYHLALGIAVVLMSASLLHYGVRFRSLMSVRNAERE